MSPEVEREYGPNAPTGLRRTWLLLLLGLASSGWGNTITRVILLLCFAGAAAFLHLWLLSPLKAPWMDLTNPIGIFMLGWLSRLVWRG